MVQRVSAAGFAPDRLERIERFIGERYIAPGRLPCALTLIHRRGEIAHLSVQGMADIERGKKLDEDAIFRIYSMTKPIASVAFMMLVEEGRVQLDEPVHRYLPEWREMSVMAGGGGDVPFVSKPVSQPMRIVDLLRHTSGLTYGIHQRTHIDALYREKQFANLTGPLTLQETIAELAHMPLEFSPGEAWNYSLSTDVVGYLIGKISGMSFEEFVRKRIFGPLGMTDTGFFVPDEERARLTACYTIGRNMKLSLQDDPAESPYLKPPVFYSGGAGLVSTAKDYLTFCRMLLSGGALGEVRLLSPRTIALMTANHLPGGKTLPDLSVSTFVEGTYPGVGFGLGFAVVTDPVAALLPSSAGEYYWGGLASTVFFASPADDLICIFMTQFIPSTFYPIRRELRALVYSAMVD